MQGPMDPLGSGKSYARRGVEPVKHTGPKGPQARGMTEGRHQDTEPVCNKSKLAAGDMHPMAKQK